MDNWKVKVFGDDFAGGTAENSFVMSVVMLGAPWLLVKTTDSQESTVMAVA